MAEEKPKILIVGGTGFDKIDGLDGSMRKVPNPFDKLVTPSLKDMVTDFDAYRAEHLPNIAFKDGNAAEAFFLARHGAGHVNSACDTNYLGNMFAGFVMQRADYGIGIMAVGSTTPEIPVGSMIVFDGIDRIDPAPMLINPYLGVDTIHLGTHGEECSPMIRQVLLEELEPVKKYFDQMDLVEGAKRPVVHDGGSVAAVCKDDTFSTPAESANIRLRNGGRNVAVGMTSYEAFSAMFCGGLYALVGLVVDMDNTVEGENVDQAVVNAGVGHFRDHVAGLTERILERGEVIDRRWGLMPLQRSILSPATPTDALGKRSEALYRLVNEAKDLDPSTLVRPAFYKP